jgi:hypothetical protein
MPERNLRILKWLNATPAIGVCTSCTREFKVPMSALTRTADAQVNLQGQFDRHKCEGRDSLKERKAILTTLNLLVYGLPRIDISPTGD